MSKVVPPLVAAGICVALTVSYVGFLYLIPRDIRTLPRNNIIHVRWRIGVVMVTSVILTVLTGFFFSTLNYRLPGDGFLVSAGFSVRSVGTISVITIALMTIFYIGPLVTLISEWVVTCFYEVDEYRHTMTKRANPINITVVVWDHLTKCWKSEPSEILLRNIVVAPITEEVVFRCLIVVVSVSSFCLLPDTDPIHISSLTVALLSPVYFSLAHLHHLYEQIRGGSDVKRACIMTVVQLIYTGVFGIIAGILLVRTGSVVSCILSHMICNTIGLPDLSFTSEPRGKSGSSAHLRFFYLYEYRWLLLVLHALGLVAFSCCLLPFTEVFVDSSPLWIL